MISNHQFRLISVNYKFTLLVFVLVYCGDSTLRLHSKHECKNNNICFSISIN